MLDPANASELAQIANAVGADVFEGALRYPSTDEHPQRTKSHESPCTTKRYGRTNDAISLDEIERILI